MSEAPINLLKASPALRKIINIAHSRRDQTKSPKRFCIDDFATSSWWSHDDVPEDLRLEHNVFGPAYSRKQKNKQSRREFAKTDNDEGDELTVGPTVSGVVDWRKVKDPFTRRDCDFLSELHDYEPVKLSAHHDPCDQALANERSHFSDLQIQRAAQVECRLSVREQLSGLLVQDTGRVRDSPVLESGLPIPSSQSEERFKRDIQLFLRQRSLEKFAAQEQRNLVSGGLQKDQNNGLEPQATETSNPKSSRPTVLSNILAHGSRLIPRDQGKVEHATILLAEAADEGNFSQVEAAVRMGAIIDQEIHGRTPFQIAFEKFCLMDRKSTKGTTSTSDKPNYEGIMELLYRFGADINATDDENVYHGWAPLHFAASLGSYKGAEWLLQRNAIVDCKTFSGETSLMKACEAGHLDIVLLLVKADADLHAVCEPTGFSVLHFAALGGKITILKFLLECGLDKSCRSGNGLLPIDICRTRGFNACAEYLKVSKTPKVDADDLIHYNLTKEVKLSPFESADDKSELAFSKRRNGRKRRAQRRDDALRSRMTTLSPAAQWKFNWSRMIQY